MLRRLFPQTHRIALLHQVSLYDLLLQSLTGLHMLARVKIHAAQVLYQRTTSYLFPTRPIWYHHLPSLRQGVLPMILTMEASIVHRPTHMLTGLSLHKSVLSLIPGVLVLEQLLHFENVAQALLTFVRMRI